jgi:hypothetical protein
LLEIETRGDEAPLHHRHSREGVNPVLSRGGGGMSLFRAAARICWIPAFAGMTNEIRYA